MSNNVRSEEAVAELYRQFLRDPDAVEPGWQGVFANLDNEARIWLQTMISGTLSSSEQLHSDSQLAAFDSVRALMLIRVYRVRGHLEANLDPLGLARPKPHPELDPATYGFTQTDMDREIYVHGVLGLQTATMRQIMERLRACYCGTVGLEFMHIQDPDQKSWLQARIEGDIAVDRLEPQAKMDLLERLTAAEGLEKFLDRRYKGTKRFGLDGGESAMPALEAIMRTAVDVGIEEIVIGMPHRGRLNVLANVMNKPLRAMFAEFQGGSSVPDEVGGSGDVKYHLGTSTDREIKGKNLHLSLTPNPSHLEAVNPVVAGKVRARQKHLGDVDHSRVMGLLMHGDAAFAGQGLVPETLQFCDLSGYRTGGIVHLIVNNQIGFTTNPLEARSSPYCSDVAKMIQAPVIHVNGDNPEAVVYAALFAVQFRQLFKTDVVIDMYCYRRHGHNEADEPAFTQPIMYRTIKDHPTTREIYAARLIDEGVTTQEIADNILGEWNARFEAEFEASSTYEPDEADWLEGEWSGLEPLEGYDARRGKTVVPVETLREIGAALTAVPDGFNLNPKIGRLLAAKQKMFETGEGFDWGTAEALAYGSLLVEGHPVRLSGEDCNRGTFSHRHAAWIDQENENRYVPLNHIRERQEQIDVLDSPLSEFGVLGFEYGYAMADPQSLVLWEAQFGDFSNGAQVIIDQFIAAGESKWLRMNGLVLLLPHGYEGQGPEHSSARLERFLQLCAEDNIQVVNCTTPASFFHVLQRQMHRNFRKPLVVMSPKSLLRHKQCISRLEDFGPGTGFHRFLHEDTPPSPPADAKQVVLCTGKVYYDILAERDKRGITDVHLFRLEQLYPFPDDAITSVLDPYTHCYIVWCQEEPRNNGAWDFVAELIEETAAEVGFKNPAPRYAGRSTSAAPATGIYKRHVREQERLVDEALTIGLPTKGRLASRKAQ